MAERGGGDGPHVLVRVVQMTDQAGMVEGPIVARISGSWSRCSLVSDGTERSDTSSGPMATVAVLRQRIRARSWIGSCGLQKSVIVSASSLPCRSEAKICCSNTRVKNRLEPGQQRRGRPGGLTDVRGPQDSGATWPGPAHPRCPGDS